MSAFWQRRHWLNRDLTRTPLYRRYGLRGVRIFGWVWFPLVYAQLMLVCSGAVWAVGAAPTPLGRVILSAVVTSAALAGAAILTRMWMIYWQQVRVIAARAGIDAAPDSNSE